MEKEKIFKKHEGREDLAGENPIGDIGQVIFLILFLAAWGIDSFFIKFSTLYSDFAPLYVRIPLAIIIFLLALYLAKDGLTIVFAETREEPIVIRKGVFSIVRHPIYLGAILFYSPWLLVSFSLIAGFIWIATIAFYIFLCKHEEKLLVEKYGKDYEMYMAEVPMLIPRILKR